MSTVFFFLSCVSTKASVAVNMPWGFLFPKNNKMQIKKIVYTVYTKVILNETYSDIVGTLSERDVKVLLAQESFVHSEKSESTPGAERGRVASLQMLQRLNPVFGMKLGVPF